MEFFKNLKPIEIVELILKGKYKLAQVIKKHPETEEIIISEFHKLGYYNFRKGCQIKSCIKFKEASDKYLELGGYPNTTVAEIAKEYKIAPKAFREYLSTYYPHIPIKADPKFDETVFDNIDTEEKAYWLGFIFADGSISSSPLREEAKTQYQFELSLSAKDREHLVKFANFIKLKNDIYCDDVRCRCSVYSKHLWNVLNCNGCTPQKSLTLIFPKKELFRSEELIRHFIRGYFDGDGCITYSDKKHTIMYSNLLGTTEFLSSIIHYADIKDTKLYILNPEKQSITKTLNLYDKKAYNFLNYMYRNSTIYLDRKYERYLEYCRLYEKSCRGLEDNIGEGCDANTEITKESNESLVS